ncbi:MAG: VOC family protein, partial [Candidatus Anstonellales archaeon]
LKVIRKLDRLGKPPVYFLGNENGFYIELLPTTNDRKERTLEDPGYSHIAIEVDNFTNFSLYLKTKGVIIFGERITSAGWRIAYFKDLEGNIIEIIEK